MFNKLSTREREIAQLVGIERHTSKQAARKLGISFRTVETHCTHIYDALLGNSPAISQVNSWSPIEVPSVLPAVRPCPASHRHVRRFPALLLEKVP